MAGPSKATIAGLTILAGTGVIFNNLLRWYPFPPGRSANDLASLESNLLGIVPNIALYALIIAVVLFSRTSALLRRRSQLLQWYCVYLVVQVPFTSQPAMDATRGLAMAAMLLSADWAASVVCAVPGLATAFLRPLWWTLVATIGIGWVIGLVLPDAVNWGRGLNPRFQNPDRAEFFFFHIVPQFCFALSIAALLGQIRRPGVQKLVAASAIVLIAVLVERTLTRTMVFSLVLVASIFLFRYVRRTLLASSIVLVLAAVAYQDVVMNVADRYRLSGFFSADPGVDATTGRLFLNQVNLDSFLAAPVFGHGPTEARRRIESSGSAIKTEHGYSIHLATSGVFAGLFFAFVVQGLYGAVNLLRTRWREIGPYEIAVAALAVTCFVNGFFGIFGSATGFYDWLAVFFVASARVMWQTVRMRHGTVSVPAAA